MIFVKRSDGAFASFEGMTQEQIVKMLAEQGLTCETIPEEDFRAAVAKQLSA